ncbi:MAG: DUF3311 domain-containing protein [Spirochaetaceae bacterium]|nr:DUF3311 domain-containing protein [Spirochaetaceae bacterium]
MTVHEPEQPARHPDGSLAEGTRRAERSDHSSWNWLLLLPLLATLIPPLYNRVDPTLSDIPFFYWYQLAAIGIGVSTTLIVYVKSRG